MCIVFSYLLELLDQLSFLKKKLNSGVHTSTWVSLLNHLLSLHLVCIDFPDVAMIYCYHYSKYDTYVTSYVIYKYLIKELPRVIGMLNSA